MSATYRYFKVTGGKVMEAYQRFVEKRQAQQLARRAVQVEFGASGFYGNDRGLVGLTFKKPREGWRPIRGASTARKPPLGKEGRGISERLKKLSLAGAKEFQAEVTGSDNPFRFMAGMTCHFMVYDKIGDTLILEVPEVVNPGVKSGEGEWQPPDEHCVPLKKSEYWALKEIEAGKEVGG